MNARGLSPEALYRKFANNFPNVSAEFGRFLYTCARSRGAKQIVEFGPSFGISTISNPLIVQKGL